MVMEATLTVDVSATLALDVVRLDLDFRANLLTTVTISLHAAQNRILVDSSSLYSIASHPRNSINARGVRVRYPLRLFWNHPSSIRFRIVFSACVIVKDCDAALCVCDGSSVAGRVVGALCSPTACSCATHIPSVRTVLFVRNM